MYVRMEFSKLHIIAVNGAGGDSPKKRRNRNRKPAKKTTVPPRDDVMTGDAAKPASPKRGAAADA